MSRAHSLLRVAAAGLLALAAAGCASQDGDGGGGTIAQDYDLGETQLSERGGGDTTRLAVGSKDFAEQEILGEITMQALTAANAEVVDRVGFGDTETVRSALVDEQVDLYWEYTGTGSMIHLAQANPPADPQELYRDVARTDDEQNSIAWLEPAPANNTYAIAVRSEVSEQGGEEYDEELAGVDTISDLAELVRESPGRATLCVGPEFSERADGLPGLEEEYGFRFPRGNLFVLPDSTVYGAVDEGTKCSFGSVFETSGFVPELGLRLLEDDRGFFPAYNPSLTMRAETLERYPDLKPLFEDISSRLDTETLRELSAEVLVEQASPEDAAEAWLAEEGLVE